MRDRKRPWDLCCPICTMLEDDSKIDAAPAPNLGWRCSAFWLLTSSVQQVLCLLPGRSLVANFFPLGNPFFDAVEGLAWLLTVGQPTRAALFSPCIKRRACTNPCTILSPHGHGDRGGDLPTTDIKRRQETWQKAKHIMETLWFQLPCIIKVIHNQKCYCFKVSLPAYTLPHTKKLFYYASSSHHRIFSWYWAKISFICFFLLGCVSV